MAGSAVATPTALPGDPLRDALLGSAHWTGGTTVTVVSTYVAGGEAIADGAGGQVQALAPTAAELASLAAAFAAFEAVCGLDLQPAASAADADLVWAAVGAADAGWSQGWYDPPDAIAPADPATIAVNREAWAVPGTIVPGGFDHAVAVQLLGLALGLDFAFDGPAALPGLESSIFDLGDHALNQGVFTAMTFNDGWRTSPHGVSHESLWGFQMGPMALDIAALQHLYGANLAHRTGGDAYTLPGANAAGTGWACLWDAGGLDRIQGDAVLANVIDLRAATLLPGPGGGGFVSYAAGIHGGFTIAHGTIIEDATGGASADRLTGNASANRLQGLAGADTLDGGAGNDRLEGGEGDDTLAGGAGDDRLDGGAGLDRLDGGAGNDLYVVATAGDVLVEAAGGGTDQVHAAASHTLAPNLETLVLTGTLAVNGSGNALANRLTGNGAANLLRGLDGNDRLDGGAGNDRVEGGLGSDVLRGGAGSDQLAGGTGNDTFVFASRAEAGDRILDFRNLAGDDDRIQVSAAGFGGGLVAGTTLRTTQLQIRPDNLARDADDRFVFRTGDATLWFDRDGTGASVPILLADLQAGATLTPLDILLIA